MHNEPKPVIQPGQRFGQLVAVAKIRARTKETRPDSPHKTQSARAARWLCSCDCGNTRYFATQPALLDGRVTHCRRAVHQGSDATPESGE